jgi:hypothetical protein
MLRGMAAELVSLPSTVVCTGSAATELIVAFRVSERMRDIAVGVEETADEVVVSVEAVWNGSAEASGGWFPYLTYSSLLVSLQNPLGDRRVRAVPDGRHAPGIC